MHIHVYNVDSLVHFLVFILTAWLCYYYLTMMHEQWSNVYTFLLALNLYVNIYDLSVYLHKLLGYVIIQTHAALNGFIVSYL